MSVFSVSIGKELLRFTAAHFIAFRGFREPLHGHTYRVESRCAGRSARTATSSISWS